jgi:hypothetical protein
LEGGSRASSGEESIAVAKVASLLLRYVSTRKLECESVGLRCEVKRFGEAGVRLKLIQMRQGIYCLFCSFVELA